MVSAHNNKYTKHEMYNQTTTSYFICTQKEDADELNVKKDHKNLYSPRFFCVCAVLCEVIQ